MAQAMYFGSTEKETYARISTYTTGSYYDQMRESVMKFADIVVKKRLEDRTDTITIADFGCADGTNSLSFVQEIVDLVERNSKGTMKVMVYFNDLPNNNFNLLSSNLYEWNKEITKSAKVFFAAVGRNMYIQCLPDGCLDIVLSSTALHFLSQIPRVVNGLHYTGGSTNERKLFQEQADKDWRSFLLSRGQEMKTGSVMVLLVNVNDVEEAGRQLMVGLSKAWREMYTENVISKSEFENATLGMYMERTEEDLISDFYAPEVCNLGLKLISIEQRRFYLEPLLHLKKSNNHQGYADAFIDFTRPWLRNVIFSGLSDERSKKDKQRVTEGYFHKLRKMVVDNQLQYDYNINEEIVIMKMK